MAAKVGNDLVGILRGQSTPAHLWRLDARLSYVIGIVKETDLSLNIIDSLLFTTKERRVAPSLVSLSASLEGVLVEKREERVGLEYCAGPENGSREQYAALRATLEGRESYRYTTRFARAHELLSSLGPASSYESLDDIRLSLRRLEENRYVRKKAGTDKAFASELSSLKRALRSYISHEEARLRKPLPSREATHAPAPHKRVPVPGPAPQTTASPAPSRKTTPRRTLLSRLALAGAAAGLAAALSLAVYSTGSPAARAPAAEVSGGARPVSEAFQYVKPLDVKPPSMGTIFSAAKGLAATPSAAQSCLSWSEEPVTSDDYASQAAIIPQLYRSEADKGRRHLIIDGLRQRAYLVEDHALRAKFLVSTGQSGFGSRPNSGRTPLGLHTIEEIIGERPAVPIGTIFRARSPVFTGGVYARARIYSEPVNTDEDLITSRILVLAGLEDANSNTRVRLVYIHGTNEEGLLGLPVSKGCPRLSNETITRLSRVLSYGSKVYIHA